ncbi:MAG: DUF6261 family protein [Tannerella sp.]|jgi:hypothetical protein|nr:DUF6261 family protein [Tannerella sp.]
MPDLFLRKPDTGHFSNADHIEYHKITYSECEAAGAVINAPDLMASYAAKVTQEDSIYKWMRKSEYTVKKLETDHERDRIYEGICGIVRVNLRHFDPAIRDNAVHVNNLLVNYGDVPHADYDAATASIDSIITRLNSPGYLPAVQNLGLAEWVTELASVNALFKSYVDDVTQEQSEKPGITSQTARRETDGALRRITDRVTALINLNGPALYTDFVEKFNVTVNHYNTLVHEHYGRLHAKTDITSAVIAPIDVQPCTGTQVYVIPTVSIVQKAKDGSETVVKLVFSEDFTVGYKNNVDPGTATLIITGIGKYTGKLVTTFNISAGN